MGFNSAFKGLNNYTYYIQYHVYIYSVVDDVHCL